MKFRRTHIPSWNRSQSRNSHFFGSDGRCPSPAAHPVPQTTQELRRGILYYSNYIFASAGFSSNSAALQTVGVGLVNLLATFLGMSLIDKLGRKTLLLIGALGMTAALGGVASIFYYHAHQALLVWLLVLFIVFFAISQGSVIWVYIAEVFPSRVQSKGQSVGSSSHWIMNALIAGTFPYIAVKSQAAPFLFFATMMLLQFFVVLLVYPETKGSSLEAIQAKFGIA